jgi:hypothetical protein
MINCERLQAITTGIENTANDFYAFNKEIYLLNILCLIKKNKI